MIRADLYHRQYEIRRFAELANDKHFAAPSMGVPRNTTLHFLPETESVWGIDASDPVLQEIDRNIYVEHVSEYVSPIEGRVRKLPFNEDREIKAFHKRHRVLRRSKKREASTRDDRSLLVVNYAPIQHHYHFARTFQATYHQWLNLHRTLVYQVKDHLKTTTRTQFIRLEVPQKLPSLTLLRKIDKDGFTNDSLKLLRDGAMYSVVDAYLMLDPESTRSLWDDIPKEQWGRIRFIWRYGNRWFAIGLDTLKGFTYETEDDSTERDVQGVRKRFLALLMTLQEAGRGETLQPESALEKPSEDEGAELVEDDVEMSEDRDPVTQKTEADLDALEETPEAPLADEAPGVEEILGTRAGDPEEAFTVVADRLADQGRLSGAEYRRAKTLARRYKSLKHPGTKEPLSEYAQITPEDMQVESEQLMGSSLAVPDDSMRQSSINQARQQYVDNVLPKDVANNVLSLQNMGAAITDYDVETYEDAGGRYDAYTIKVQPLVGAPSTLRFKLPKIEEDGTFTANGVTQYMRWQRGDIPIRKTAPEKVALTSYYGKVFVTRSEKVAYDYGAWLIKTLIGMGLDEEDTRVKSVKLGSAFDHEAQVPRIYSTLSQKILRLEFRDYSVSFDREALTKKYEADMTAIEQDDWLVVGRRRGSFLTMVRSDPAGTLYQYEGGSHTELGTLEELIGLDITKAPVDTAELNVFSKAIPLGLVLGYLLGFRALVKALGVTPRIIPSGERMNLQPHEYTIRFANESFVFSREDEAAALILNGYNQQKRLLQRYSSREFDRQDVYKNLLDEMGLGVRYARELDMMDTMFVDPITLGILQERHEPETLRGLLFYANTLLLNDWHPHENDLAYQRLRGYERMAGAVYQEMVRAARGYAMNPNTRKAKFEMNPEAVWMSILQDPSVNLSKGNNPISQLRENEDVTFSGVGGRSLRSMVERTRHYHHSDLGVISEATVDSGKVGSTVYLSADPNLTSVRGMTRPRTEEDGPSKHFSTSMLLASSSDKDDAKRICNKVPSGGNSSRITSLKRGPLFQSKRQSVTKSLF